MNSEPATPGSTAIGALPLADRRIDALPASTCGFVGLAPGGPLDEAVRADSFEAFAALFSDPARARRGPFLGGAKLAHAVRGYFRNGGRACWVVRAGGVPGDAPVAGVLAGVRQLAELDEPSAIAVPDAHGLAGGTAAAAAAQRELVAACARVVGRIALVDPPPGLDPDAALSWRAQSRIDSATAAAYYPWVEVSDPASGQTTAAPPCGHAAGIWARVDARAGPHQAPTAEALIAADGPVLELSAAQQHRLNRAGVNCLRNWPGPELRAWGARTMSADPEQRYLHRQRIVGHIIASIAAGTRWAVGEPPDERLRERLRATVAAFLNTWWRAGALLGDTQSQAFFVRCVDDPEHSQIGTAGEIVLEIGLAVRRPGDFRVLRIAHRANAPATVP
jgi:phage tail sheath protein FI